MALCSQKPLLCIARGNDIGSIQQKVLLARSQANRCLTCVFTNLCDALDPNALELIDQMLPKPDCSSSDTISAYENIEDFLFENYHWALESEKTAFCLAHKRNCPFNPGSVFKARQLKQADDYAGVAWWSSANVDSYLHEGRLPLCFNLAGIICVDDSPMGKRRKLCGASRREHAVWMATRHSNALNNIEDGFFTECSSFYPARDRQEKLNATHEVISVRTGPENQSYPMNRGRCFSASIARWSLVWCGPAADLVEADFHAHHHKAMQLTGSIYFNATLEEVSNMSAEFASGRHQPLTADEQRQPFYTYAHKILSDGSYRIRDEYVEWFKDLQIGKPHFADLQQHPGRGPKGGSLLPTLDTHPRIYSFDDERIATPFELAMAMGIDVRKCMLFGDRELSPLASILPRSPAAQQFTLIANGAHILVMASWYVYVLSDCNSRSIVFRIPCALSVEPQEDSDDDAPLEQFHTNYRL